MGTPARNPILNAAANQRFNELGVSPVEREARLAKVNSGDLSPLPTTGDNIVSQPTNASVQPARRSIQGRGRRAFLSAAADTTNKTLLGR